MSHGLLLASLGLLCWTGILRSGSRLAWLGAGLALGLVALTKMEILLAASAASAVGILAVWLCAPREQVRAWPGVALFAAAFAAPGVVAIAALSAPLGLADASRAVGIGWVRLLGDDLAGLPFYQRGMGVDDWLGNISIALLWAARLGGLFAPAALLAFSGRGERFGRPWVVIAVAAAMVLALAPFADSIRWLQAARPLPFLGVFAVAWCARRLLARERTERFARLALQTMAVTFATVLMAKIFILGLIYQYGFSLILHAALLFFAALVSWVPGEIDRRGGRGAVFRAAALGFLVVTIGGHLLVMAPHMADRTTRVGGASDAIRVQPGVARAINRTLATVNAQTEPGDTLTVMPEGVMLNFLARRPTATPHFSFNPFELHVYGEDKILRDFQASPPAAVVLVHHDTSEHGARFLGRDYGRHLMAWIRSHYQVAQQLGDPPLEPGTRFGIAVLEPTRRSER